jgi:hypothetical protein
MKHLGTRLALPPETKEVPRLNWQAFEFLS